MSLLILTFNHKRSFFLKSSWILGFSSSLNASWWISGIFNTAKIVWRSPCLVYIKKFFKNCSNFEGKNSFMKTKKITLNLNCVDNDRWQDRVRRFQLNFTPQGSLLLCSKGSRFEFIYSWMLNFTIDRFITCSSFYNFCQFLISVT